MRTDNNFPLIKNYKLSYEDNILNPYISKKNSNKLNKNILIKNKIKKYLFYIIAIAIIYFILKCLIKSLQDVIKSMEPSPIIYSSIYPNIQNVRPNIGPNIRSDIRSNIGPDINSIKSIMNALRPNMDNTTYPIMKIHMR